MRNQTVGDLFKKPKFYCQCGVELGRFWTTTKVYSDTTVSYCPTCEPELSPFSRDYVRHWADKGAQWAVQKVAD